MFIIPRYPSKIPEAVKAYLFRQFARQQFPGDSIKRLEKQVMAVYC
jgi:hypothetical protein